MSYCYLLPGEMGNVVSRWYCTVPSSLPGVPWCACMMLPRALPKSGVRAAPLLLGMNALHDRTRMVWQPDERMITRAPTHARTHADHRRRGVPLRSCPAGDDVRRGPHVRRVPQPHRRCHAAVCGGPCRRLPILFPRCGCTAAANVAQPASSLPPSPPSPCFASGVRYTRAADCCSKQCSGKRCV